MSGSSSSKENARAEEFKRATAGVLRAIAEQPDVQVAFQPGPSGVSGKRARLPLPTRALPAAEMARLRRTAHAVLWLDPHLAEPDYEPLTRGLRESLPHVRASFPGDSLAGLAALTAAATLEGGVRNR